MIPLLGLVGADCERMGGGVLAQPVNAWSSLAFLGAGVWIAGRIRRHEDRRLELFVFGAAVGSNAVGGLLFHGGPGALERWVHDLSILSVLLFIVVFDVARLREHGPAWTLRGFLASLAVLGGLMAVVPDVTYALYGVLGVGAGGFELLEYRHELPRIRAEGLSARRLARLGVLVALALAATAFFVGRTGGPLCRPDSAFQWHAVWHALAAAAMALYAFAAIEPERAAARETRPTR